MQLTVFVSRLTAYASMCNYGATATSRKQFVDQIRIYVTLYGDTCIDDHPTECDEEIADHAKILVQKYYD